MTQWKKSTLQNKHTPGIFKITHFRDFVGFNHASQNSTVCKKQILQSITLRKICCKVCIFAKKKLQKYAIFLNTVLDKLRTKNFDDQFKVRVCKFLLIFLWNKPRQTISQNFVIIISVPFWKKCKKVSRLM